MALADQIPPGAKASAPVDRMIDTARRDGPASGKQFRAALVPAAHAANHEDPGHRLCEFRQGQIVLHRSLPTIYIGFRLIK